MKEIYKIKKVNCSGKWIEFWFHGSENGRYDKCCKNYMFGEIVDNKDLFNDIKNNGCKGLYIVWESDRPCDLSRDADYILDKYVVKRSVDQISESNTYQQIEMLKESPQS